MPPPGQCVVDLNGSPYTQLALRPIPCNTEPALVNLNNGASVTILNNDQQYYGCNYAYTFVQYVDPSTGATTDGYVGTEYVDCNTSGEQQSCGSYSVAHGGPTNACGSGKTYSASDSTMCNADGSNCVAQCCSPNLVYRRAATAA